jgi:singapore isolate B (sub-type 7) whole genome shotgun sequence assembly, scaffold_2
LLIAFAGSCAAALAYIAVRKVGPSVSAFVLINYILIFTMLIAVFQSYFMIHIFPWPKKQLPVQAWLWLVSTGFLGAGAQVEIECEAHE